MIFCYTFVIFINIYLIYMCALIATNCLIRLKHNFWLSLAKVPTLAGPYCPHGEYLLWAWGVLVSPPSYHQFGLGVGNVATLHSDQNLGLGVGNVSALHSDQSAVSKCTHFTLTKISYAPAQIFNIISKYR